MRGEVKKELSAIDAAALTGRDVVTHFLRREAKTIAYNEPLVHEGFDVEGVHQLRVSARRLRSEIQAMRDVLPPDPWRDLSDDLKWMGTVLGRLRDLDVLAGLFEQHVADGTRLHDSITSTLERRRQKRRREVSLLLDSSRYSRIVKRIGRLKDHPELGEVGRTIASELFLPPLWEATCTYLDAVGDPFERRSDEALHRVRIASKKCRYNFEIAALYLGDEAKVVATSLEAIQDILGKVQDRSVAVSFLDTLGLEEEVDLDVRRALRAEIGELRPQWVEQFNDVRRGILDVFGSTDQASP
jgi:CHAD domain-containing protein